jgi:hypothetical protein
MSRLSFWCRLFGAGGRVASPEASQLPAASSMSGGLFVCHMPHVACVIARLCCTALCCASIM